MRPKLHLPVLEHVFLSLWCHGKFVIGKAVLWHIALFKSSYKPVDISEAAEAAL
jgi:hypothetical protein